jgi:hypothetical protein
MSDNYKKAGDATNTTAAASLPDRLRMVSFIPATTTEQGEIDADAAEIAAIIAAIPGVTPKVDAAGMITMKTREMCVLDEITGEKYYVIGMFTAGHIKPV